VLARAASTVSCVNLQGGSAVTSLRRALAAPFSAARARFGVGNALVGVVVAISVVVASVIAGGAADANRADAQQRVAVSNAVSARSIEFPEPTVVGLHWNVAGGGRLHRGRVDTGMAESVVAWIIESNATFVSLNEICQPQFDEILRRLQSAGWIANVVDHGRFAGMRNSTCMRDGVTPYGNGLIARVPLGPEQITHLPHPILRRPATIPGSREWRNVLCANELGTMRVYCTTHVTTDPVFRDLQLRRIVALGTRLLEQGWMPIMSGDFNATASKLGGFAEQFTHLFVPGMGVRVDHIFVPTRSMTGLWSFEPELPPSACLDGLTNLPGRPCSDHARLRVRVALRPGL
jgi:hypothetical protein